eukprot:TRINITY_DN320_c0_g1_i3.p1 TRINITY_DN320_c0_g1~~TRINITY_DN320_c0_g1_i3.p1  ORF type:complete len:227 (+),score=22.32 TRINITY_DN320_c0_g1_i3:172-852(+)
MICLPFLLLVLASQCLAESCISAQGLDLSSQNSVTHIIESQETRTTVIMTICGFINQTCGYDATAECYQTKTDCCTVCDQYGGSNPGGSCYGKTFDHSFASSNGVGLYFTGGDAVTTNPSGPRSASVVLVCDQTTDFTLQPFNNNPPFQNPTTGYVYNFTVNTRVACPGGGSGGSISGGGWFLIILLAIFLPLYVIGGSLWNKFQLHKEGAEVCSSTEIGYSNLLS